MVRLDGGSRALTIAFATLPFSSWSTAYIPPTECQHDSSHRRRELSFTRTTPTLERPPSCSSAATAQREGGGRCRRTFRFRRSADLPGGIPNKSQMPCSTVLSLLWVFM